ncbi:DUF1648 domain-containing protein [Syntrophomonas erecta]
MSLIGLDKKRPFIKLPLTRWEIWLEVLSALGILMLLFLVWQSWGTLPDKIPSHFGITGQPDAWGNKSSLITLPIIAIATHLLLTIVSKYPHTFNYPAKITEENAEFQYLMARYLIAVLKVEIIWLFAYIEWIIIKVALGKTTGLGNLFLPVFLLVMLGTLGVYFYNTSKKK